jgi:hypothetical protein
MNGLSYANQEFELSSDLLGFRTLSIVRSSKKLENTTFRKLDLFLSSGEGGEIPTLFGPLERANLNHWLVLSKGPNRIGALPHLRKETDPVPETLCSLVFRI